MPPSIVSLVIDVFGVARPRFSLNRFGSTIENVTIYMPTDPRFSRKGMLKYR